MRFLNIRLGSKYFDILIALKLYYSRYLNNTRILTILFQDTILIHKRFILIKPCDYNVLKIVDEVCKLSKQNSMVIRIKCMIISSAGDYFKTYVCFMYIFSIRI